MSTARYPSVLASIFLAMGLWLQASPARAVSLADLIEPDATLVSGSVVYSNFEVKVSGKGLASDLSSYIVSPSADNGFQIVLADGTPGKKGNLKLEYDATSSQNLEGAALSPEPAGGVISIKNHLKDKKNLGKLSFKNKPNDSLELAFDDLVDTFHVKSKIRVLGLAAGGSSVAQSAPTATPVPEPGTAALLAMGVLGLAARARRA